ncbi:MAG: hypothetical protein KDB03_00430 [Planctomycetales bacterium]|nr:hypothetical protein [Planctomycetales bacterium]
MDVAKKADALQLLDELDAKHDRLLIDLDALSSRIEKVLEEYLKSRDRKMHAGTAATTSSGPEPEQRSEVA